MDEYDQKRRVSWGTEGSFVFPSNAERDALAKQQQQGIDDHH